MTSGHSAAPIYPQWIPPEAARVLETWGRFPPAVKQAIVALIEEVDESPGNSGELIWAGDAEGSGVYLFMQPIDTTTFSSQKELTTIVKG